MRSNRRLYQMGAIISMSLPMNVKALYPSSQWEAQAVRYQHGAKQFHALFGRSHKLIFSAPGRSEIIGNHTDHNMGKAIGAAVSLDILAFVAPRSDGRIRILSEEFPTIELDTTHTDMVEKEKGTSSALIRGICHKMKEYGYQVGGFDAYTDSQVPKGSGLSSSAAFEVLIASILDHLYNEGTMSPKEIAILSQYAENVYFGKGSGLLDQLSCAYGGMIFIDFEDPSNPTVHPLKFDITEQNYTMVITNVHSDHTDLTAEYTAIKEEMQAVAGFFQKEYLRQINKAEFEVALPLLHRSLSQRAILRAVHYLDENDRVDQMMSAIQANDFSAFKNLVMSSGRSSFMYLQNIYPSLTPENQALSLALCITERNLGARGAWRVHGGGFGGTIQTYLPTELAEEYVQEMDRIFGAGSATPLQIRPVGPVCIK